MRNKWSLFTGILLLTVGIILRKTTELGMEAVSIIIVGVLLKVYYIISKVRSGEYRPGIEVVYLFVGLTMFLSGLYLKSQGSNFNPYWLMAPGITLKIVFIIIFTRKIRGVTNATIR